jgi:hypothetical protein
MFEQALILRAGVERKVDLGLVAETLFLYGSTHLLLDRASLIGLTKSIPGDDLLAMFDRGGIKLSYLRQNFAVLTAGVSARSLSGAPSTVNTKSLTIMRRYSQRSDVNSEPLKRPPNWQMP